MTKFSLVKSRKSIVARLALVSIGKKREIRTQRNRETNWVENKKKKGERRKEPRDKKGKSYNLAGYSVR